MSLLMQSMTDWLSLFNRLPKNVLKASTMTVSGEAVLSKLHLMMNPFASVMGSTICLSKVVFLSKYVNE